MSANPDISIVPHAKLKTCTTISLVDALIKIREGTWQAQVEAYRALYATQGKEAARAKKEALPALTFSGAFSYADGEHLLQHSGYICADFDNLGAQAPAIRNTIGADHHCRAAFISAGGKGVKALFRCDLSRPHLESWKAVTNYCHNIHGLENDPQTKDVSRLCFVSHDPEAVIAAGTVTVVPYPLVPVVATPMEATPGALGVVPTATQLSRINVVELLLNIDPDSDYDTWLAVISGVGAALGETHEAIDVLRLWSPEKEGVDYA